MKLDSSSEFLEADGRGGFASGTVGGIRTRRYHALLLTATTPPTGRVVLVNGFDAWVETPSGREHLSAQMYAPDVEHPDGRTRITDFVSEPWPRWTYTLCGGGRIEHELFVPHGRSACVLSWRFVGQGPARLAVRPFLSGRDYHSLHHENAAFRFDAERSGERVRFAPYADQPAVVTLSNGAYRHDPQWYRNFLHAEERDRGLDFTEDLGSPGLLEWDLTEGEASLVLATDAAIAEEQGTAADIAKRWRASEKRRRGRFETPLLRAADAYVVERGEGRTIVAGYPWFTDWGRDTFIALRGLCLATGRLAEAKDILLEWSGAVSEGMLPNLFVDRGGSAEYNSVDASLWYVVAVRELLESSLAVAARDRNRLQSAVEAILEGYARGTRYGIRCDEDGLLAAGEPGVQLTWMDAKVGDWVVTPRIGKPVEVQALWVNALAAGSKERWAATMARARDSFARRFWNEARGCLYDVVDVDHRSGVVDARLRPNQIFAVGGLPVSLLDGTRARRVVDMVEAHLLTPLGPRSLAPGDEGYAGRYQGGVRERDRSYHQGTVWPWLLGPFVEAWVRVRGGTPQAKAEARARFLVPIQNHLGEAGIGHVSEIADGDAPHAPRGCPFQAWSVGELLRLDRVVL